MTIDQEWVLGSGSGAHASMSATMVPTRRQHGLLIAVEAGRGEPTLLLSRIDERLDLSGEKSIYLGGADYPNCPAADSDARLSELRIDERRVYFLYRDEELGFELARSCERDPQGGLRWSYHLHRSKDDAPIRLSLRPLYAYRSIQALQGPQSGWNLHLHRLDEQRFRFTPLAGRAAVALTVEGKASEHWSYRDDPCWYHDMMYRRDEERGYSGHDHHGCPGVFEIELTPGQSFSMLLQAELESTKTPTVPSSLKRVFSIKNRRTRLRTALSRAAEQFIYRAPNRGTGIVAGFPWFREWGRDTMIALPGLTLAVGDTERCNRILVESCRFLNKGRLPNIFGQDIQSSAYNSLDASLWFSLAVDRYDEHLGRATSVADQFLPLLIDIAQNYDEGFEELGVECRDGLLFQTRPDQNLSWMDAKVGPVPVTPRLGAPVEINALWIALLFQVAEYHQRLGLHAKAKTWQKRAELAGQRFVQRFWCPESQYLADRVLDPEDLARLQAQADPHSPFQLEVPADLDDQGRVLDMRPNQLFAIALPRIPLSRDQRRQSLERCDAELLTPRGLRTLSPLHPDYIGRYEGSPEKRDGAYHQGTVWPWLLGAWADSTCLSYDPYRAADRIMAQLEPFADHLEEAGIAQISEIFDGDAPHRARGCTAQAWSVAELLRAFALAEQITCAS